MCNGCMNKLYNVVWNHQPVLALLVDVVHTEHKTT